MSVRRRTIASGAIVWVVDYRDGSGTRRNRNFSTRAAAIAFAAKTTTEVITGTHVPEPASVTVREACALWLERAKREQLERATVGYYDMHIRLHILPFVGDVKLTRLSIPVLTSLRNRLLDCGRTPDMVRRVLVTLSGVVRNAQRQGLVATNNVPMVERIRRDQRDGGRPVMPTRAELAAILNVAQQPRDRIIVLLGLFAGLRGSEIRGLVWGDVDLKAGILHIRRRADRYGQLGRLKSKAGTRDIPTGALLRNALKAWRLACPVSELDLVVPTADGWVEEHITILRRAFWPLQLAAGVVTADGAPKYGLHALRHACAALWIEAGFNAKEICTWMGHSTVAMTYDTYGYLINTGQDAARGALDQLAVRLVPDLK
jgi:integrase